MIYMYIARKNPVKYRRDYDSLLYCLNGQNIAIIILQHVFQRSAKLFLLP